MASLSTIYYPSSSIPKTQNRSHFSSLQTKPTFHHLNKKISFSINSVLSTKTDPNIPQTVQTFWQWLKEEGVVSAKTPVKPGLVPEGLGLVATRDISRNDVVLEVPKKFWINPDAVAASEIGSICSELKPWISVALFLLRERFKGKKSKLKCYIDILPECTNSTIYWSEEELLEIQGTQLLSTTLDAKEYLQSEFCSVKDKIIRRNKKLFPFRITSDDFFWAFGILKSRAFPSHLRNQDLVIVPFADLTNHSDKVTTEDHVHEDRGAADLSSRDHLFQLRSPLSFKAGEQVYIRYDMDRGNADLAIDYGFIEPNSDRDAFTLIPQILEYDDFFKDKMDIAKSNGFGDTAYFNIKYGKPLPKAMLKYLRLVVLGGSDACLLKSTFRNKVWGFLELPVSRANEELVCRMVRSTCKSALLDYPTTIEEDEKLMEKGNLSPRLEMAVWVRRGEKRVLQQIDDIFKEREMELDSLEYYQDRRLKDL